MDCRSLTWSWGWPGGLSVCSGRKEAVNSGAARFGGITPAAPVSMSRREDAPNARQPKRKGLSMNIRYTELPNP